jgi:hypothetical protein
VHAANGPAARAIRPAFPAPGGGSFRCGPMHDRTEITPDRCAALVAPHIERLIFAVVHASIGRAGPQLMQYGVPIDAIDIVGQLHMGLAARPVSAAGLAAAYRYQDADRERGWAWQVPLGIMPGRVDALTGRSPAVPAPRSLPATVVTCRGRACPLRTTSSIDADDRVVAAV